MTDLENWKGELDGANLKRELSCEKMRPLSPMRFNFFLHPGIDMLVYQLEESFKVN
jgi:hypothetical protein